MMKNLLIISLLGLFFTCSFGQNMKPKDEKAIRQELKKQQDCWNKADIECFMEVYWNSPELIFVGSNGVNKGWDATIQRYKRSYPNKAAMGKLDFTILKVEKLGPKTAFMLGQFYLTREIGDASGHFTLIWKKIDGKWLIVADHSS